MKELSKKSEFGKIFLEMLSAITPDYKKEDIISIVKKIYQSGNKTEAGKICNIYGSRGFEFLRDTYDIFYPIK